jgi:hypothetical protein
MQPGLSRTLDHFALAAALPELRQRAMMEASIAVLITDAGQGFIAAHCGTTTAESTPAAGTRVSIALPRDVGIPEG